MRKLSLASIEKTAFLTLKPRYRILRTPLGGKKTIDAGGMNGIAKRLRNGIDVDPTQIKGNHIGYDSGKVMRRGVYGSTHQ